jgi:hypothetical protein
MSFARVTFLGSLPFQLTVGGGRPVDVPRMITGLADVALRASECIRDQGSARVALWAFDGSRTFRSSDLCRGKASAPCGSTGLGQGQESTEKGELQYVLK